MKREKRKVKYKGIEYSSIKECIRQNSELNGMYDFIKKWTRHFDTVDEVVQYRRNKYCGRVTRIQCGNSYLLESDYPITEVIRTSRGPSMRLDDSYIEINRREFARAERRLRHEQKSGIAARKREDKQSREYFQSRGADNEN